MRRAIARGRVFPQSYSTDRRYGRLSLKACALFPLMWANADDQGRLCGDPEEVKYAVCPNIDHITKADIPELLEELVINQLIKVYDTQKSAAIQILDWWDVNQKMQWAWPSEYPPPEGWKDRLRYKRGAKEVVAENWEQESTEDKPVYFIIDDEAKAVKIGVADSPQSRLRDLQFGNPHKLRLGKIIENGGYDLEQKLHRLFSDYALDNEWFHLAKEIEDYIFHMSSVNSGESLGEFSGETSIVSPLTTPSSENEKEIKNRRGTRRGKRNSPESSGEEIPPPSPRGSPSEIDLLHELTACFKREWGRVPAHAPDTVIPREPDARESAQLRDLAKEISAAGGCPLDYIHQAFREAAGQEKMRISYCRAVLLDWLGIPRSPP